jgi:phosphate uptake regulator
VVDPEEKIRSEARKFVSVACEGLTEEELREAEDDVVELIKDTLSGFLESDEAKDMKDDDVVEVHLSKVDLPIAGESNGNEVNGNGRVR